jgi:hypothetical protein
MPQLIAAASTLIVIALLALASQLALLAERLLARA